MIELVIVLPQAEIDIAEARGWYSEKSSELGDEFLGAVEQVIAAVKANPELHPTVYKNYRKVLLQRFPYKVYYEFAANCIFIYAVVHGARGPRQVKRRLP